MIPPGVALRRAGSGFRLILPGDVRVHRIRGQIDFARPCYRAAIDKDLPEKLRACQRREYTGQFPLPQAHVSCQSIFESDEKTVVLLRYYFDYVPVHRTIFRSCQRLNLLPGPRCQSPARQVTFDDGEWADVDCGFELTISGVDEPGAASARRADSCRTPPKRFD